MMTAMLAHRSATSLTIWVERMTILFWPMSDSRYLQSSDIGQNKIVILSTHIVSDVADLCANMAVINKGQLLLTGEPLKLMEEIDGKIWTCFVDKENVPALQQRHAVISTRLMSGRTVVHVYSDSDPGDEFELIPGDLEDVYFATISGHFHSNAS